MHLDFFPKQHSKQFFLSVLSGLVVTRFISLIFFAFANHYPKASQQVIDDGFHHYYLGLALLVAALLFRKQKYAFIAAGFGVGIVLEEAAVVLDDLGLQGFRFYYLNGLDFILVVSVLVVIAGLLAFKSSKR